MCRKKFRHPTPFTLSGIASCASALAACLLIAPGVALAVDSSVWVEAEDAVSSNVISNNWYNSVRKQELSGRGWLSHFGKSKEGSASFAVTIPAKGSYTLWVRANPVGTTLDVRFDENPWKPVPTGKAAIDNRNIASDGKPDLRFLAWSKAGKFELPKGSARVSFRMRSKNANHGAIDCFCLTTDAKWKPSGTLQPGQSKPHWPAPSLTDANIDQWLAFIRPGDDELGWRKIRWHKSLDDAAREARKLNRPILLWTMNGHPCGET